MTVWCHLPTIFSRRFVLRFAMLAVLIIAFITTQFFSAASYAAPGVNKTLSFQGRLLRATGAVVPDGHYNIQFNLYQDGSGTAAGNPGGTLEWTETYTNNGGTSGVEVRNGVFSVNLGSKTPFGTSVDWNQDTLWLSMNVAGSSTSCTTFGTAPCVADGEMTPMKRINSVPTAINSSMVGGKTADQLAQIGQGTQTDASDNSSLSINKIGTGNLIQLQNAGADIFTVNNTGSILLGGAGNQTISVATGAANVSGGNLSIAAGNGGTSTAATSGGSLTLQGGNGDGTNGNGGNVTIDSGSGSGSGTGGIVAVGTANAEYIAIGSVSGSTNQHIWIGANDSASSSAQVTIGSGQNAAAGDTTIRGKDSVSIESNGANIIKGTDSSGDGTSPQIEIGSTETNSNNVIYGTTVVKAVADNPSTLAFQIQRANGTAMFVADSGAQTVTIGDAFSANRTVISSETGKITKYGTARNTNTISLTAEYAGSVLDAGSGSNNTGTMTSGVNLTDRKNYYKWTTSQSSNQSYDVVVQVPIPKDFDGWASSNPLSIDGYTSDVTNGTITLEARDSTGAVRCNFASATPSSANTWSTNTTACTLASGTYTPGDYMTLRIRMQSPNGGDVRIGNINLSYLSNY